MKIFLLRVFIFASLMPYVSPIPFPMDTAPYSVSILILLLGLLVVEKTHFLSLTIKKKDVLPIGILFLMAAVLTLRFGYFFDFDSFRILGNYISLMLFYFYFSMFVTASECSRRSFLRAFSQLIVIVSFIYIGGTLLQVVARLSGYQVLFDITDKLLSADISLRTSENRGFTSFAAEPSYAGIVCSLLVSISAYIYRAGYLRTKIYLVTTFNYFVVILLSAAATALPFFFMAFLAVSASFHVKVRVLLFSFLFLGIVVIVGISKELSEIRFFYIISSLINDGLNTLLVDVSFLVRFASPFVYSFPLLSGQNIFGHVLMSVDQNYLHMIINEISIDSAIREGLLIGLAEEGGGFRTLSAIGQSLFLFGIFAALFWVVIVQRLSYVNGLSNGRLYILTIIILGFLIQVPLGHPTFSVAIGFLLFPNLKECTFDWHRYQ